MLRNEACIWEKAQRGKKIKGQQLPTQYVCSEKTYRWTSACVSQWWHQLAPATAQSNGWSNRASRQLDHHTRDVKNIACIMISITLSCWLEVKTDHQMSSFGPAQAVAIRAGRVLTWTAGRCPGKLEGRRKPCCNHTVRTAVKSRSHEQQVQYFWGEITSKIQL